MTDFNEWKRQYASEQGLDEVLEEALSASEKTYAVLTFKPNRYKDGVISDYKGLYVFPDQDSDIQAGDAYLCLLTPYDGPKARVYYANPVRKIDTGLLMEIDPKVREDIVSNLWSKHGSQFEKRFEEKYLATLQKRIEEETREGHLAALAAKDEDIKALRVQMGELRNRLAESRPDPEGYRLESDEIVLTSEEEEQEQAPRRQEPVVPQPQPVQYGQEVPQVQQTGDPMARSRPRYRYDVTINGNLLRCSALEDGEHYFVHVSPDARTLLIRPNEDGRLVCYNDVLCISGLKEIFNVGEPGQDNHVEAEYSDRYGGMIVHL